MDETLVDDNDKTAEEVLGMRVELSGWETSVAPLHEQAESEVRRLLENAPVDRAWRRRGLMVMCRAFPDRMQLRAGGREALRDPVSGRATRMAKTAVSGEVNVIGSRGKGSTSSTGWVNATTWLLEVEKEDIFRKIVYFL